MNNVVKLMLEYSFSGTSAAQIISLIRMAQGFYIIADPSTTRDDWERKKFAILVEPRKILPVFMFQEEAIEYAKMNNSVIGDQPLITKTKLKAIARYCSENSIANVRFYSRVPLSITVTAEELQDNPVASSSQPASSFVGVDRVRKALDTYEVNARRKIDPGAYFENIHTLVQSLIQENSLDHGDIDKALGLTTGRTRDFCLNVTESVSKELITKYLDYFGLKPYLYVFAKNSTDLINELHDHRVIDNFKLKKPTSPNCVRYRLMNIEQGSYEQYYIYRLTLQAGDKKKEIVVSNPLNLQVGREYQITTADGFAIEEAPQEQRAADQLEFNAAKLLDALDTLEAKNQDKQEKPEKTYEELRRDAIINYLVTETNCPNAKSAKSKYMDMEGAPDILDEFYKYIEKRQFGKIDVQGYTARKLIQELHLSPYEAYMSLIHLRQDPKGTKQWLVYRERDPQYQKGRGT